MRKDFILVAIIMHQYSMLLAAPSIEACPPDSQLVEDTCKCDPAACRKPPCLTRLQISTNGSDVPGACCPTYACEGCAYSSRLNDLCPCAPGAILHPSTNQCACVNPLHSLINASCVCDPDKCPLPAICEPNSVQVQMGDCCTSTQCVKCPEDSFATNYADKAVENKCVCFPCSKECGAHEKVAIIEKGTGFAGKCCDIYQCERVAGKCFSGGAVYEEGATWRLENARQLCECKNGISFCVDNPLKEQKACLHEDRHYESDESWMQDSCTNCTCLDGAVKCLAHFCDLPPTKSKCPPLTQCAKSCAEGFRTGKNGCPVCRCKVTPNKSMEIWLKYNLTKNQVEEIIEEHLRGSENSTMRVPINGQDSFGQNVGIIVAIVILVVVVVGAVYWLACRRQKKGSYNTCPPTEPLREQQRQQVHWHNNNNVKDNVSMLPFVRRKLGELLRNLSP